MKSMNTYFSLLIAFLLLSSVVSAQQTVVVGTAIGSNGPNTGSPVNIFYESMHYQTVYTATELTAAGFVPGAQITSLAWDVTEVPNEAGVPQALPNYTIRLGHTANTTSTLANHITASTLTIHYTNTSYLPTLGFDVLTFSSSFIWNGSDNIVIDVCFDQLPDWASTGTNSVYNSTDGAHYHRADGQDMCGTTTGPNFVNTGDLDEKPVVQFDIITGPPPNCDMIQAGTLTATNILANSADISWDTLVSPSHFLIEYGQIGFTPGTGTFDTTSSLQYNVSSLLPVTTYLVRVQQICGTAVGDTSYARSVTFTTPCSSFPAPYLETFAGTNTPNCWAQSAANGGPWVFTGNPGYLAAGTVTHTADGSNFAWVDFSGTDENVILETAVVDVSTLTTVSLSFWFKSVPDPGDANNILIVEAFDGNSWHPLGTIQQDDPNWLNYSYNLAPYIYGGGFVKARFIATRDPSPANTTFFTNDLMLDDISVDEAPADDAAITDITIPFIGGCNTLSNSEMVTVTLENYGSTPLDTATISLNLNGAVVATDTFIGTIPVGGSVPYTFTNPIDLSIQGELTFDFTVSSFPNDDVPWNDLNKHVKYNDGNAIVTNFPYTESFDNFAICFSDCDDGSCGAFGQTNGWRNSVGDDDSDWSVNTGGTLNSNTGPTEDHTSGTGRYLYTPSTGCVDFNLVSPCFDFSGFNAPEISFWYHMQGNGGTLTLEADSSGQGNWAQVWSLTGNQGANWVKAEIPLDLSYINTTTKFRFVSTTTIMDIAIDDIRVGEIPANDVIVTDFVSPQIGGCNPLGTNETVTVELGNLGIANVTSASVSIKVNNVPVGAGVFTGTIAPSGTALFTLPGGVNLSTPGEITVEVTGSALPTEDDPENDVKSFVFYNDGAAIVNTYPYTESFDSWNICLADCLDGACGTFGLTDGWRNSIGNDDSDWSVNTGTTPTSGTGPISDHTGGGNYLYTEANGCNDFYLLSPCFDFGTTPFPELSFWYHANGGQIGSLVVEADSNGTGNWVQVWSISGSQGPSWQEAEIDLTAFSGTTTKFRFKGIANGSASDISIDDILMRNVPPHDLQVTRVVGPLNDCGDEQVFIDVTVFNYGGNTETDYTVTVDQTGNTVNTEFTIGTVVLAEEDSTVVSVGPFNTAAGGVVDYTATVTINNAVDNVPGNDNGTYQHKAYALSYPQAIDGSRCGFGTVDLGATGIAEQFFWYSDEFATNYLDTGAAFTTGYLYADTTLWIEGRASFTDFFGPQNKDFDEGSYYDHHPDGLVFDAKFDMTIESVNVYPISAGDITINVKDAAGMLLHSTTYVHLTSATVINIPLGFNVPAGTGYTIDADGTTIDLYRNKDSDNNIGVTYPYTLNDAVSITGPINNLFDAYYFFYNWEVTYLGCPSERIPVQAVVNPSGLTPAFNVTDESLPGNGAVATTVSGGNAPYNFNWDNGLMTSDITNLTAGTYFVTISDANDCTDTFSVVVENIISTNKIEAISNLSIFPNPSNGQFNVSIELDGIHEVALEIVNTLGQVVYSTTPEQTAANQYPINLSDNPSGIYQIKIRVDDKIMTRSIMIK